MRRLLSGLFSFQRNRSDAKVRSIEPYNKTEIMSSWSGYIYPRDERLRYLKMIPPISSRSGCTTDQISAVERELGAKVCAAHREFLLYYGQEEEGPLRGSDCFLRDIVGVSEGIDDLLSENGLQPHHPSKPICVFMHQGYMAAWYYAGDETNDPVCFYFGEAANENIIRKFDCVSDFISNEYMRMAANFGSNPHASEIRVKQKS